MLALPDIVSYAVFTGFEFAALYAMTRGGCGWPCRLLGFAALVCVDVLADWVWRLAQMPLDLWLSVLFAVDWSVFAALVVWLSRDSVGRRLFLAITYGVYAVCFVAVFHWLAYRNALGLSCGGIVAAWLAGLAVVAAMNLAFLFWILPQMPHDGRISRWRDPCVVAGVMFAAMFASGLWPVSVVSAPTRYCVPFVLVSAVAWVAFPMICRSIRGHLRNADVEHSLELMTTEVKARRAAIDLARRLRHDQRHHRAQIAEYMLFGQYEKVFAYLKELDDEAQEAPTGKFIWCENETVNAILSVCARKAAARGVAFSAEVHAEREVGLPDVEMVAVFANLIENAVNEAGEAKGRSGVSSETLPQGVRVMLRQREFGIGITVSNPVREGFALSGGGLPCAEPGIGMESIRRVVERYDGEWTYELNAGLLKCQVILMWGDGKAKS